MNLRYFARQLQAQRDARIAEINARIEWMCDNYEGCDWCCGGGDEEMDALHAELAELQGEQPTAA